MKGKLYAELHDELGSVRRVDISSLTVLGVDTDRFLKPLVRRLGGTRMYTQVAALHCFAHIGNAMGAWGMTSLDRFHWSFFPVSADCHRAGVNRVAMCALTLAIPPLTLRLSPEKHCDAARGEFEARIEQRRAHAVLAFLHRGLGQADDREVWKTVGEMYFDGYRRRVNADLRAAVYDRECHP